MTSAESEETRQRRGLLTRTLFEVLRDADGPLAPKDAVAHVQQRVDLTPAELSLNKTGVQRFVTYLGFASSWASTVGWLAKRGGWAITEAGIEALVQYPDDQLYHELTHRYRQRWTEKRKHQRGSADAHWAQVATALTLVEAGWWTTYGDLAELAGLPAQAVGQYLAREPIENAHRVLRADGTIAPGFHWADPERTDDPRVILEREGVAFDAAGRADPSQRITVDLLRERLAELEGDADDAAVRRAWLVRGSSVDGRDLVPVWLVKESVSLAATSLRPVVPPVPQEELRRIVEEDYQHKSYAAREAKVAEFDAFCNRMRPDDYVLTTSQGKAYVGRVTGEATYVHSGDKRSNLRREVEWLNPTGPVPFARLPQPLPAKLHSQSDVVELTENTAAIESLLANLGVGLTEPVPTPARELSFEPISAELADDLLIDADWLQHLADLLWDRKQVILYGPPGTGKTYMARKLAGHLAEPSAVKLVQFHPSYTYEDFFEGFRPVQRDEGQLAFELRPGPFRRLVEAARQNPSDPYILIIDEINRANLAKVFGELYFLLEYRNDAVGLLYSAESDFTLPENVFVIGTMNTTDRSIALVDAAMRRRFGFVELHPSAPPTAGLLASWLTRLTKDDDLPYNLDAPTLLDALNDRIEERDLAIGPSYVMKPDIYRRADGLDRVWETSILPLLAEHHYGSPPEVLNRYRLPALRAALARRALDDPQPPDDPGAS
jgi:5-methylcytosine-specific restriction protein B